MTLVNCTELTGFLLSLFSMDDIPTICRQAETLLAEIFLLPVRLDVQEQFESNHTVLRCTVHSQNPFARLPGTVIVTRREVNPEAAPDKFDQSILFRNEWASLDFLTSLTSQARLGPRLIASDRQIGLVVLEDLGSVQTVQDVLYGPDRQAAMDALLGMGRKLGQIQNKTFGRESEFLSSQAALGAKTTLCDANLDCRAHLEELHACLSALDIPLDPRFDRALLDMENAIHGPGHFRTFVHNDAGPHNFVVTDSGVQLLDFEFAGYGHGLLDVVCARLAFPPAFRGRVLPMEIVRQLEAAYRAELISLRPEASDDRLFTKAVAQACAHWAFSKLIGVWDYLDERLSQGEARDRRDGRVPERNAFLRQQVFSYLRLASATLEEFDHLPELHSALSKIVNRLMQVFPETPLLDTYPAFGGEPWHYP